ncbi:DUF4906 domain-containing protein [Bacteroides stercorirosoris]|uniref:DUF4906 domain-containing protein n=1 Tax=Bacteroides stercorirosoris TaxID=871324 RepID=UPI0023F6FF1E|nr:DUF4906 domain-containing protein [Bacteroides stercorirosoris]
MIRLFEYRVYRTQEEPVPFCWKVLFVLFMLGTLLAMTAVCSSCQPEEDMEAIGAEEDLPATIRLEVQGEELVNIATRDINESVVSNLHILVYNSSGELIGQKYQTGSSTVTVNTRSATGCTIYAIANTGKADLFKGYAIHKESYLKSMVYSLTNWDDLGKGTNLLMTGSMKSVNIKAGAQTLATSLALTRMVARVELKIKVKESSGITITDYSVKNIPSRSYYIARASEDAVQTATAAHWKESGVIAASGATSVSKTFYMFENRRGTKSISAQKDKTTANAPAKATYVVIHGLVGAVTVTWTVYLGENNTSDFNIKRNGNYTYNITLNDVAATDTRVVVDFAGTEDLSSAGTANCYLAKKVNTWYKFKATVRGNGAATAALISPTGSALAANAAISPASAELVWETNGHGKIIQGVILKDGYVYFKTGPTAEGNAVIAVKDRSSNVLWSWHIWKTHFNLAEMPAQTYKTNPRIMNASLYYNGLVSRNLIMMDRNVGAEAEILYNSDTKEKTLSLFYQFGRKDPFPAGKNKTGEISIYDKDGNHLDEPALREGNYVKMNSSISKETASIIAYTIAHPLTFILYDMADVNAEYIPSYNWIYGGYPQETAWKASNNLWGGDVNGVSSLALDTKFIQKTIYDPCPLGWHMPPQDVWTNFTTTNTGEIPPMLDYNTTIPTYYNSPIEDKINVTVESGGYFNTPVYGRRFFISSTSGEQAFYPAVGYRYGGNGQVYNIGYYCCVWSSSPYDSSSSFAHYLGAINEGVGPTTAAGRGHGFPVRCIKETP